MLQQILSRSLEFLYSGTESASGLLVDCDYMLVIKSFETQILTWQQEWIEGRNWDGKSVFLPSLLQVNWPKKILDQSPISRYKMMISHFYFNYAMLVLNSFGLQNAMEHAPLNIGHFFSRVHCSATACATIVRDQLGPNGFMKYSPDSHFVQTSYAVLSLLKVRAWVHLTCTFTNFWIFFVAYPTWVPGLPWRRERHSQPGQRSCWCSRQHLRQPSSHPGSIQWIFTCSDFCEMWPAIVKYCL